MTAFAHTPYASGASPFSIGLAPIDAADWIESDARLAAHLAEKDIILASEPDAFAALNGEAGQQEALEMLVAHLPRRFPEVYRREGDAMRILPAGRGVALGGEPPLLTASRLVQEDLLLMHRARDGWRLAAGSLCFPSIWSLRAKLGLGLDAIHAPVPGFAGRMSEVVSRIFDSLRRAALLERFNWSIYGDGALRHAATGEASRGCFPTGAPIERSAHIRVERQTLRLLPVSGDILFTVRIHVDPLAALAKHPRGATLAGALREQLAALDAAQIAYKGLGEARERLITALDQLSTGAGA